MEIIPIFANEDSGEGLYSIKYDHEDLCEYDRLIDVWTDMSYVSGYLKLNNKYLQSPYFAGISFDGLMTKVYNEIREIDDRFRDYYNEGFTESSIKLKSIFRPLWDGEYSVSSPQIGAN